MSAVIIKELSAPPIDRTEILRYMRCPETNNETEALIDKALSISLDKFTYKICFCTFPIKIEPQGIDLGFATVQSQYLAKTLSNCEEILLFAATVGLEIDRLIYKYGRISPSLAVCLQAIGSERIEALCNTFCADLRKNGLNIRPRFSAGYGDLPLSLQKDIFAALACDKHIGLTLNDSQLMSPTKSVTAIIGVDNKYEHS